VATTLLPTRAAVAAVLSDLEELWRCSDELFASLAPAEWRRRHGRDWTYADVPYHLSYFDRELVARPLARGRDVPLDEQRVMGTLAELDAWNRRMFAQRPADETPERSLARLREVRAEIRAILSGWSDEHLQQPAFMSIVGAGWLPASAILDTAVAHTWSHLTEARLRLGRPAPAPPAGATHRALGFFANFMPRFVNREEAARGPFTAVMTFDGPGGGSWTTAVADGAVTTVEGAASEADLRLTMAPETFEKMKSRIQNPILLMLTGQVKVRGFSKMGRYGRLFAMPGPETPVEPYRARL
jgi:hypothetical protein